MQRTSPRASISAPSPQTRAPRAAAGPAIMRRDRCVSGSRPRCAGVDQLVPLVPMLGDRSKPAGRLSGETLRAGGHLRWYRGRTPVPDPRSAVRGDSSVNVHIIERQGRGSGRVPIYWSGVATRSSGPRACGNAGSTISQPGSAPEIGCNRIRHGTTPAATTSAPCFRPPPWRRPATSVESYWKHRHERSAPRCHPDPPVARPRGIPARPR